jgi:hypothetical protein
MLYEGLFNVLMKFIRSVSGAIVSKQFERCKESSDRSEIHQHLSEHDRVRA